MLSEACIFSFCAGGPGWLNELDSWITQQLIQAYHQYDVGSRMALYITKEGALDSQPLVVKFISCLSMVDGSLLGTPASSTNKTGRHDIAKILLKVTLNTINQIKSFCAVNFNSLGRCTYHSYNNSTFRIINYSN